MYQFTGLDDTIVAISTATGQGGIGIIRLSGGDSIKIADKMFKTKTGRVPSTFKSYMAHYGWIQNGDGLIDEALLTVMRAPKSYTTEDIVEISCHGGIVPLRAILNLAIDLGARSSEPGEFTKRAFLSGRIDLAQAEAVLDIIQSKTTAFLRVSHNQLKGELSQELKNIRSQLMNIYTEIEAIVNFPEDDIDANGKKQLLKNIERANSSVRELLKSSEHGKVLKEGIKIVLCGKPNVGKSSLLNCLLKQSRAIVTDVAGTTRDAIEETAHIRGIPFQLVDTAGILEPRDLIEKEAIKRSHMYMEASDLILFVIDSSNDLSKDDHDLIDNLKGRNVLVVVNKYDLGDKLDEKILHKTFQDTGIIKVSALKKKGIDKLEDAIAENIWQGKVVDTQGVLISNVRHIKALENCDSSLKGAIKTLEEGTSLEFVSEQIKEGINYLDSITGRNIDNDLLETIFSSFCIGK